MSESIRRARVAAAPPTFGLGMLKSSFCVSDASEPPASDTTSMKSLWQPPNVTTEVYWYLRPGTASLRYLGSNTGGSREGGIGSCYSDA